MTTSQSRDKQPQMKSIVTKDTPYTAIASPRLIIDEKTIVKKLFQPGETYQVVNETEHGFFHSCAIYADSPLVGVDCNLVQIDGSTYKPWSTHNTPQDLLSLGMGLAPGDVVPINNISPDPAGYPNHAHPFVTRYKSTSEADITGEEEPIFGMAYLPEPPIEYSGRITFNITNFSDVPAGVHHFYMMRKIFRE